MKESVIITNFKMAEKQRIQNNQMIGALVDDTRQMQEMLAGFLNVIRRLPGYTEAIAELAKEHEEAEAEAAKNISS